LQNGNSKVQNANFAEKTIDFSIFNLIFTIGELGGFVEAGASPHIARFDDKANLCQQVEKVEFSPA